MADAPAETVTAEVPDAFAAPVEGEAAPAEKAEAAAQEPEAGDAFKAPEEGGDDKGAEKPGEKPKADGAPEAYADFKLPEGMKADPVLMTEFQKECRELGLNQEAAQAQLERMAGWKAKADQQAQAQWTEKSNVWRAASKEAGLFAPDILAAANRGIRAAGGDAELVQMLGYLGFSNHPAIIRAFANHGKSVSQDTSIPGSGGASGTPKSRAQVLFGDTSPPPQ